jgi:hypothetical protein
MPGDVGRMRYPRRYDEEPDRQLYTNHRRPISLTDKDLLPRLQHGQSETALQLDPAPVSETTPARHLKRVKKVNAGAMDPPSTPYPASGRGVRAFGVHHHLGRIRRIGRTGTEARRGRGEGASEEVGAGIDGEKRWDGSDPWSGSLDEKDECDATWNMQEMRKG